jgi:hypothetical protein
MLGYWPYAGKQNIFYFIFFFDVSTKPGIFIPDLYLYSTKIQPCRKSQIF